MCGGCPLFCFHKDKKSLSPQASDDRGPRIDTGWQSSRTQQTEGLWNNLTSQGRQSKVEMETAGRRDQASRGDRGRLAHSGYGDHDNRSTS